MSERLLNYLVEHGMLTREQANQLRARQREGGKSIRELLIENAMVSEENLLEALAAVS